MNLDDPTAVALLAAESLSEVGIEHALYGGLVLAAYGAARETRDADLAVAGASLRDAAAAVERRGLHTEIAFERTVFGGLWVSRIALIGGVDPEGLNTLDLVEPRSRSYAERALARALSSTLRGQSVRLLTPEDFVVFKVLSTREIDLEDARSVCRSLGSELDRNLVESELDTLDRELGDTSIAARRARVFGGPG